MTEENEYLLGTDRVELERLKLQHDTWAEFSETLMDRAGFPTGGTIMDIGAGPGYTSLALAARVGASGKVLAVDTSNRFADFLKQTAQSRSIENIDYLVADVHDLPSDMEALDGAFARWVFCFLKEPETVIRRVAQHLKPGGSFAILDYYNYLAACFKPESAILRRIFPMVRKSFADSGGNLDIGDDLPVMLADNGFTVTELFPINTTAQPGSRFWNWFEAFRASYFPKLEANGYLTAQESAEITATLERMRNRPGSYFSTPPMLGIVAVKD
ncbi:MAG: methyltransferase domain-containing protein [Acidobacteriota bacterium]|nr:methyltransferase domain-containing protein [Acidobacteriota bacterium]